MSDDSAEVRRREAEALERIKVGDVPALINALSDDSAEVRRGAAIALVLTGPDAAPAVPALIDALTNDSAWGVRSRTAEALGRIGPEATRAVPALIKAALSDDITLVRHRAAEALGRMKAAAAPALINALSDDSAEVRDFAALALGRIGPEAAAAVPALINALSDDSAEVRRSAALALERIGPEAAAAVPALINAALSDDSAEVRRSAAQALMLMNAAVAVPALINALSDDSAEVRRRATEALRNMNPGARALRAGAGKGARPQRDDQDVRFTIYHPKEIATGSWDMLLVYAHLPEMQDWVHTDAQSHLERPESHGLRKGRATRNIARGAEIMVVPELPGCRFNPPTDRFRWLEDAHRREFRLQADPEMPGFEPGTAVNGRVAFYVSSILVAKVAVWTFVSDQPLGLVGGMGAQAVPAGPPRQPMNATAAPYEAIFVSYAHDDSTIVARIGAAYEALGMSILRDQEVLRSGEKWNPRLLDLIEQADIFQLCWSDIARRSKYVRQEWRHALKQERDNFIRPVYWQKPLPKPPRELKDLHFAYLPLDG